jgi:hypothetical protein
MSSIGTQTAQSHSKEECILISEVETTMMVM